MFATNTAEAGLAWIFAAIYIAECFFAKGDYILSARTKKKKTKRMFNGMRHVPFVLVSILLIGMTTAAICGMAFALYVHKYINPISDMDLENFKLNLTSNVVYIDKVTGEEKVLEELHGSENRVWVDIEDIPLNLQHAFIAIEDERFYKHDGVDWKRSIGAAMNYVVKIRDNFGGGSTITQQLVKNLTGDDETSVKRKISEIMRALDLDKKYSKDDILEMYLNKIYLGQGTNGVRTASLVYFGKQPSELTIAECAALASITKNPSKYDPYRFPAFNEERRAVVLENMRKQGYITQEEKDEAVNEQIVLHRDDSVPVETKPWSYFTDEVFNSVTEDLMEQKGYSRTFAEQMLYTAGLKIVSTIDPEVQAKMDAVFEDTDKLPGVLGKDGTMPQAAMVIMDQTTGNVVAMYGGRGQKQGYLTLNRATRTFRAPGSAIKPITAYAPAIEYGLITPISVLDDVPKDFNVKAGGWPSNSTNGKVWAGRMTVTKAIAVSNNTIPVDLIQQLTTKKAFDFGKDKMGLSTLLEGRTITDKKGATRVLTDVALSPLALGGLTDGVSVLELTAAYCTFGNDGKYIKPRVYSKVYDSNGNIVLDNAPETNIAMSQKTADYMLDLLVNVVAGPQGTGAQAQIKGIETGGKTGTADEDYDRWFVGLTPYYTAAVWFGYDKPQTVKGVSSNPSLKIWKEVMTSVHVELENKKFERKTEYVSANYCLDSGLAPGAYCARDSRGSRIATGKVAKEDVPTKKCDVHVILEIDKTTGKVANEYCPNDSIGSAAFLVLDRDLPSGMPVSDSKYVRNGAVCTEHNADNDGNKVPEVEEPETPPDEDEEPDQPTTPDPAPDTKPTPDTKPIPEATTPTTPIDPTNTPQPTR